MESIRYRSVLLAYSIDVMSRVVFPLLVIPRTGGIGSQHLWMTSSLTMDQQGIKGEGIPTQLCEISTAILPTVKDFIKEFHFPKCPRRETENIFSYTDKGGPGNSQKKVSIPKEEQWRRSMDLHSAPLPPHEHDVLEVWLRVGRLAAPLTILGEALLDGNRNACARSTSCLLAAHTPGLPGAFVFPMDHLRYCRCRVVFNASPSLCTELGSTCLLEAVRRHLQLQEDRGRGNTGLFVLDPLSASSDSYLDGFYRLARKRHFSLVGLENVLDIGSEINTEALELSFPYHCGGEQASKTYFDILPDAIEMFQVHQECKAERDTLRASCSSSWEHGAKVLSRYGVTVCVGVRPHISSYQIVSENNQDCSGQRNRKAATANTEIPTLFWHPAGATAACMAPLLHSGIGTTVVGKVSLEYNGPSSTSPLLVRELPSRYLLHEEEKECLGGSKGGVNAYDQMTWLHRALFGVDPKEEWRGWQSSSRNEPVTVHGIRLSPFSEGELELYLKGEKSGEIFSAADI